MPDYKYIDKAKLQRLLEPHFKNYLLLETYAIQTRKARKLLSYTRYDLAFKLLYLEMKDKNVNFAKELYKNHIGAFSLGEFVEPGNEQKNTIESFIEEFDNILESIKHDGFDSNKSLVPLSRNGSIANGAHRVASAIYTDKDVECVQIEMDNHIYDYKFFHNRNMAIQSLDIAATKYVEYADDLYIALLWPTAQGRDDVIEKIIPNIVYRKEVKLNPNGAHNLLSQIYYGEEWLGNVENNFRGSQGKLVECFKTFNPIRIVVFQTDSLNEVLKIKDRIRDVFNVGKHSIHITDTKEEAIRTAKVLFNNNSIHFLNHARPNRYLSTHAKIAKFKNFILENGLNSQNIILDSGMVLSAYGLRESSDIDYLINDNSSVKTHDKELECHDEELVFHDKEKDDLIYNPQNYFFYNDLKFISFEQLYKMKKNRREVKDINDCNMMEALIENDRWKQIINKVKQNFFYLKIKLRAKTIKIFKYLGIYEVAKNVYKSLKRNQ